MQSRLFKIVLLSLSVILAGNFSFAQSYTMSNSPITACSGTYLDPGGTGNYGNSQDFTQTICPSTPGAKITLNFTAFSTENNYDYITIYDGNSTAAPTLGTYMGTTGPGLVQATAGNASGCITIVFHSDGSVVQSGWTATIACTTPCVTPTATITSSSPAASGGIIRICQGGTVNFSGSITGGPGGADTYAWNFGNGSTSTSANPTATFATAGSYMVSLNGTEGGCPNTNSATVIVQVSTTPTITTTATPTSICLGQSANLGATVTMNPFVPNCTPPVSGTTFLPDGSGVSYTTSINVNCYNASQTVTSAANFSNVCLNIEHSYLGDLNIVLVCPNGQSIVLKAYPGGNGTFLGGPYDGVNDATYGPGVGSTYCFTPGASTLLVNGPTQAASGPTAGTTITPGNYMPVDPFTDLIGCPLNGAWTIQVTDNLGSDNGYIFNWDVNFTVPPATGGFTPTIASQGWNAATGLTSTGATTATVTPTAAGSPCYTYSVTDNFGCTYNQVQCITVNPNTPVNAGPDVTICQGASTTLTASGASTYSWSNGLGTGNPKVVSPATTTTYTVTGTSAAGCVTTDQVTVTVVPPPTVTVSPNVTICNGASTTLTAAGATTYSWNNGLGTGNPKVVSPTSTTTYTVTGTNAGGCTATATVTVTVNPLPTVNAGADQTVCQGTNVTLAATGASTYSWTGGVTQGIAFAPPVGTTTYTVTGTSAAGCTNTDQVNVTVNPTPVVNAGPDQTVCAGGTVTLTATGATTYSWSTGATTASINVTPATTTTYTVTGTSLGCTATDAVTVTVAGAAAINAGLDVSICAGQSTTLTATGGVTYSWNNGLGAGNGFSVSPATTTTYTVTGTDAGGCVGTDAMTVTVNPLPVVNAGLDQTVCAGASVTLTASGAATYSWNNGVTNGIAFVPAATTTYTVTGTTAAGCTATDQVVVTVNPLPVVNAGADQTICAGASVTLTATGAATYSWSGGVSQGVAFTPAATATYTVTGTTAAGCTATDQVVVTVNPLPIVNAGTDQAVCTGTAVTLTATGASTYSWNNGVTQGVSFTPAGTNTYTVTGTDANGCVNTDQVVVTVNPLPTINAGPDVAICVGASTTLTATGGATYTWNNGATQGGAVSPATTTTYTVTGTSAAGCVNTDQVIVTVNPLPVVNAGADQAICTGASVTLTASGAATYTWNNGVTNGVAFTPASTTTYTVTGTSAAGCIATDQVVVTVNPLPTVNAGADQTVCAGTAVTLTATGAVTYTWNNGISQGVSFTPAATTTYTVTGTDGNGCINTDQVLVTVNPLPTINAGPDVAICVGASTTLTATGGATYTWNNGAIQGGSVSPATTTTYTVTGTSATGCINTDQVVVTVNPLPAINAGADFAVCTGGSATLNGSGGVAYTWNNGVTNGVAFVPPATTTYTVTGTDANGCINTDQITVSVLTNAPVNAGPDVAICIGQSTTLTATGAVTFNWDQGLGTGNNFVVSPTGTTTYTVVGTDGNGCTGTDAITVTVNPLPIVNAGADQTVCQGTSVTLTATGAATYSWNNGVTNGVAFTPAVGTVTYTVTGTTAAGCTATDQVVVTVNALPTTNAGTDQTVCAGTSVTLTATGAASYSWNNGVNQGVAFTPAATTTYTVTGTSAAGCTTTDQVTVTVNPLPTTNAGADQTVCAGTSVTLTATGAATYSWDNGVTNGVAFTPAVGTITYTVTGTTGAGCIATDQVIVTVNPNPNPVIQGPTEYCAGYSATLSTSTPFTTYNWSTGATTSTVNVTIANNPISVTVTNGFGCQATSATFSVVENSVITANFTETICQGGSVIIHGVSQSVAGTYSQTFTSASGCDSISNVTLVVNPLPAVNAGIDQAVCTGTSTTLTASGAANYSWNNGVTNGVPFTQAIGTTTYTVTGTDVNGCINTDQVNITVNPLPTVNAGVDQSVCIGGSVTVNGSGASTYTWNNGVTNGTAFSPSVTTTYTVTGTDVNGCINTDQMVVTVNPLPNVSAGPDVTTCAGGSVTLSGSGAVNYAWNNGISNGVAFTPASTTTYTVTGTDANGCVNTDQVVVTVAGLPNVNAGVDQTVCVGTSVTLSGSGAATYSWNNGVTNSTPFTPAVGTVTYTVTGTDGGGCINTDQVTVTVNPLPNVNAGVDQTVCIGTSVTLNGSGASSYSWNNGVSNGVAFTPAVTNTFTVTGTDLNGCINTDQVTVTVNPLPNVNAGPDQTTCAGGSVTLSGTGAINYSWNNGVTNGIAFTPASTNTYTVTGTDANGCINTDQVVVNVAGLPVVNAGPDQTVCLGASVTLSGSGASTYTWNNGVSNGVAFTPAVGTVTYTVTGTDAGGCINTDQVNVTVNPLPVVNAGADQTICIGASVTLTGSGASTYSWNNGVNNGVAFMPAVTNTYTVTGTNANGCINTDQVVVTVNPLPIVNAGPDQTTCAGGSVTLAGSGASNYTWNNGVTNNVPFIPSSTATYTVTGTDVNGCINTDQAVVNVSTLPTVNAGPDQTVCFGTSVTLSGSGAATYTWNNGVSNGVAFTPAVGTVTYTVTGTDAGGCINTDQVTVTVNPLPVVNAGPDQTICIGASVTLSGSGASTYTWNNGVVNNTPFTPALTSTYTVTGTDLNGCINTDQVLVTVNPLPVVNAGPDQTVCVGATVTLAGSGAVVYSWNNGVTNAIPFTPAVGTVTYTVTGTDANGCIDTDQAVVTVNALPNVGAGNDLDICVGTSVTLSGTGASTYTWTNGVINGTPFTPSVGLVTYTVTGTDMNGCTNTDQVAVNVNPSPLVNAGPDQIICIGESVTLTATGAATYSWNNGVTNGVAFTPSVGIVTYTATGTSAAGCTATDNVIVIVNALPNVFAGNDLTICDGETVTLTGSGAVNYTWNNGVNNGTAFTPAVGTASYTVTGTDANGCINTDQVSVTVNPLPNVSFTPGATNGCTPFTTTLTNTTADAQNCVWTISNGQVLTGCGTVPVTFSQGGCFDVTLTTTSTLGCTASFSANDLICVEDYPNAEFSPSSNNLSTLNTEVMFENYTTGATQYSWTFGVDDEVSNEENPIYTYPNEEEGQYTVTLIATSPLGCTDTAITIINVYEELIFYVPNTFTPDLDNYNPVFQPVFTSGFDPQDYVLYIYNRWGELIFESHNTEIGWDGSYGTWDQSENSTEMVQDGVYTWKIEFKVTRYDERKMYVGHVNLIR